MLTALGQEIRRLRMQREMTLRSMARALNLSPAFISAVETGKKAAPQSFVEDLARILQLSKAERLTIEAAMGKLKKSVTVKLHRNDAAAVQLAFSFARRFPELTEEQKRLIQKILD